MTDELPKTDLAADAHPAAGQPLLRIEGVAKTFGTFRAVDGVSLDIKAGEFFALLGPSGCGKTTLLRMLAGFEAPDEGRILLDGKDIAQALPHERPINMMFQNYALFPHLSVRDNIAFGLKRAGLARTEIATRVAEMVALVKLEGLEKRKPDQLSGGQRQRVALARALARRPKLLLLDEPLAALDKKLRENTQGELMELQRRLGMTFIIVTHDQEEAMTMADRIGVMKSGKLAQVAPPRELYEAPRSRWIAEFVGDINLFDGESKLRDGHRLVIGTRDAGTLVVAEPREPVGAGRFAVAIRPEKIKLSRRGPVSEAGHETTLNRLDGVIADICYLGGSTTYKVKLETGGMVQASVANSARLDVDAYSLNQHVVAWFTPDDCVVLPS
ncbi:ABC transporter ATP-binding protein [Bradyrhizobium sp. BR 10289]|uniref:ABC transporter ATP-binding protein n=1 Tax=Bradyrhizobium sp. BR 10289 TaxID=2749993 RepID=UPI001C651BCC|nr:ABC transporter ATP-binding protein [Bradyrhizobium sp. BR 10289]MBW7971322.1 ABC transporter ATP-binding protein [Bradyrhizobium sp. BR 10289]